nr:hypothetical protein [Desulfomonile sp.]
MKNQRGSAVAIVMLVLAVVSLIGVALLTQSRLDMQLTTSLRVYDDMTSRADARATEGLVKLRGSYRYDVTAYTSYTDETTYTLNPEPITGFTQVDEGPLAGASPPSSTPISRTTTGTSSIVGYSINPPAGWQKGSAPDGYVEVFYVVKGRAWNPAAYKTVLPDGNTFDVPETTVSVAASVVRKKVP